MKFSRGLLLIASLALVPPAEAVTQWRQGELQIHFIYTGRGEQAFYIFPDGTSMLVDCGDYYDSTREPAPIMIGSAACAGEYVADYVQRVNPADDPAHVDYLLLTHYHEDHTHGLPAAIERLKFDVALDRTWPDLDHPCRIADYQPGTNSALAVMRTVYPALARKGTKIEKFVVGRRDQIVPRKGGVKDFSVFNLTANGFVADERTGEVVDCYKDYPDKQPGFKGRQWINENGLSLGFVLRYGAFRYYAAGDFSDRAVMPEGVARFEIEDVLAEHVGQVTVAKFNHHGFRSMPAKLVRALRPEAWVNCVWNHRQNTDDTLERVLDRKLDPNLRAFHPTFMSPKRPSALVASSAYEGRTVVLTVSADGNEYGFEDADSHEKKEK